MNSTSLIKSLLLFLLASARGIKAFILGCCCFNSVDNLSAAIENNEEINPADFSHQWKQLWHCAGHSWLPEEKLSSFISHTPRNDMTVSVRLDTQWRQVMAFNHLSNLVSQLRCCHRLSGAPTTDAAHPARFSFRSTTRYFAVVLFLCLFSLQTRGNYYVLYLCRCLSDRCCSYLYGRRIS